MPTTGNPSVDNLISSVHDALSGKGELKGLSEAVGRAKNAIFGGSPAPAPAPKPDTSWHDQQVAAANEAFRKQSEQNAAAKAKPATKSLPKYKDGTDYVPKTGPAILHKGEAVLDKDDADEHRARKMAQAQDDQDKDIGMSDDNHVSLHRALTHLHKGGLHNALHVPQGQPIPQDKLEKAKNSSNPHIAHMARFASVLEGFHHKDKDK